ncbi:MAG: S8 family serine peptidase [Bacteroides sp.]|nr:S8 family serine peptidase [Bacteroides sp.]
MKKAILILLSAALLFACNDEIITSDSLEQDENPFLSVFSENEVIPGRMRIKLKEEPAGEVTVRSSGGQVTTGIRALDGSATLLGITRMQRTFPYAGKYEERTRREGLHLWYDVWFSEEVAATRAAGDVTVLEGIETAIPVPKVISLAMPADPPVTAGLMQLSHVFYPFDDPDLSKQWGFINPGTESWQQEGADVRLQNVWQQYNGHPDIIVAIVDGGIELTHPDLQANLWINEAELNGAPGYDDDQNGYDDDIYGYNFVSDTGTIKAHRHGTHVAGTIGAVNNNGIGVSGIAGGNGTPNSGVRLMSCQIFEHQGNYTNDIVSGNIGAAIKYGADNGAVISQNSWGYAADAASRSSRIDLVHKEAIDYFVKYAGCDNDGNQLPDSPMKGGIVFFASGNSNSSNPSVAAPADYEKVIGVAAIGPDYKKPSYSNYGDYMAISAPGGGSSGDTRIWSTTIAAGGYNYYEYRYGTSMACPHVAGVAALVIEKHGVGKQGFTATQLEELLLTTAYDIDRYNPEYAGQLGTGCVDAQAALSADLVEERPAFLLESNPVTDGTLSFRVTSEFLGSAVITIYNGTGSKVFSKEIETKRFTSTTVDISGLSAGYYTLEFVCNGTTAKEKFIKY